MRTIDEYPPGLIGTLTELFGRAIAASHGVDWTVDAMIAEQQCQLFRQFDPSCDRVWVALEGGSPHGALTIDGPRPEMGRHAARLRFFILDESLRGLGPGRLMMSHAIEFCRERGYRRISLTTLHGLDAAMRLYESYGFTQVGQSAATFHGSRSVELTLEPELA
ncbi:MAG TPA: GNAT family N-acetyltransferase [Terracidiphilus sp.]|nr:GNAT family N-acetyltransferase [Terracidiphilus sp.]